MKIILYLSAVAYFLYPRLVKANTPEAASIYLSIEKELDKRCKSKGYGSVCKKELMKCLHSNSKDFPFDALEILDNNCKKQK